MCRVGARCPQCRGPLLNMRACVYACPEHARFVWVCSRVHMRTCACASYVCRYGAISTLFVQPEFRRRALAQLVVAELSAQVTACPAATWLVELVSVSRVCEFTQERSDGRTPFAFIGALSIAYPPSCSPLVRSNTQIIRACVHETVGVSPENENVASAQMFTKLGFLRVCEVMHPRCVRCRAWGGGGDECV